MSWQAKKRALKRGSIYILPNMFTTLSLFFGFYSILASIDGRFGQAAWFIIISTLRDGLDGTTARAVKAASPFGGAYDSLCDMASFGAAPAVLVYLWALTPEALSGLAPQYRRLGSAAAFIFLVCGALRLARFNVFSGTRDPGFFQGLPITGGALMICAAVIRFSGPGVAGSAPDSRLILGLLPLMSLFMISSFDYLSHKNKALFRNRRPFETLAAAIVLLIFIIAGHETILLPLGFIYLLSGPLVTLFRRRRTGNPAAPMKKG